MARDRRQKFIELANKRTNKAAHQIRLVGNLADTSNYKYSYEEARKMIRYLRAEIDKIENQFKFGEVDPIDFELEVNDEDI